MPQGFIQVPKRVLTKMVEAGQQLITAEDELEDFLLASNSNFVRKMRRLRQMHRRGRLGNWGRLKARYGL